MTKNQFKSGAKSQISLSQKDVRNTEQLNDVVYGMLKELENEKQMINDQKLDLKRIKRIQEIKEEDINLKKKKYKSKLQEVETLEREMIQLHDKYAQEQKLIDVIRKFIEKQDLMKKENISNLQDLFQINEMQNEYLKSKYLQNEKQINKVEKQIEKEAQKMERSKKLIAELYLSKQVQFYDQKLEMQQTTMNIKSVNNLVGGIDDIENMQKEKQDQEKEKLRQTMEEKEQLLKLEVMMIEQLKLRSEKTAKLI